MQTATNFLIQAIIGFALYIVLLRFWMQWVRADFRNELGQFVITVTNPLVIPLRKALPSIGTLDTASVVLAMIVAAIKLFAFMLVTGVSIQPPYFLLIIIGILIKSSIWLFLIAILIGVIASWIKSTQCSSDCQRRTHYWRADTGTGQTDLFHRLRGWISRL